MIDVTQLTSIDEIRGCDEEETTELKEMHTRAASYITMFKWAASVGQSYFGWGVGGVVAVFLFAVRFKDDHEELVWVIVGDLPSAYLGTGDVPTPADALESYCELMEDWVSAVRSGNLTDSVYPVDADPTSKNAELLEIRVRLLRTDFIPQARLAQHS